MLGAPGQKYRQFVFLEIAILDKNFRNSIFLK